MSQKPSLTSFLPGYGYLAGPSPTPAMLFLYALTAWSVASVLTLPLAGHVWIGDLPLLALLQVPKVLLADWLRQEVVMSLLRPLGLSSGSPSPDSITARPWALALAYLLLLGTVTAVCWRTLRTELRGRRLFLILAGILLLDCVFTLYFGKSRWLTIY